MKKILNSLFARIAIGLVVMTTLTLSICLPILAKQQRTTPKAVDTAGALSLGNILSDDGISINSSVLSSLATAVGGLYTNGETTQTKKSALNDGQTIIFQMGTAFGNLVSWQVVYRTGNYITAWMTDCYTNEYFNLASGSSTSPKNTNLAGYTTTPYDEDANYSRSILRDVTNGIYNSLVASCPAMDQLVVSPIDVEWGDDNWQAQQPTVLAFAELYPSSEDPSDNCFESACTNGLYSNTNNGSIDYLDPYDSEGISDPLDTNPYDFSWDESAYQDKLWIPSMYELLNTETAPGETTTPYYYDEDIGADYYNYNGLWGLSWEDLSCSTTALDGSAVSCSWSRSSGSASSTYAYYLYPSGADFSYTNVNSSYAVRPALHLNLESAVSSTEPRVSATISDGTVSPASQFYTGSELTFNFTANTDYQITEISIGVSMLGSVSLTPSATSEPSSYTTLSDPGGMISGACKYKIWISGTNKVTVKVTDVSTNDIMIARGLVISATTELAGARVTTYSPSGGSVDKTTATYSDSALTFTYTANSGYWINSVTIGGTSVAIASSKPSSYTTLTNLKCKVWRDTYKVIVEVTDVTATTSMSATTTSSLVTTNNNTSTISSVSKSAGYTSGTVYATYSSGYYPKVQLNSSGYLKLANASGSGKLGSGSFSYTFSSNKLTLSLSGLDYGINTVYLDSYANSTATTTLNVSIQGTTSYTYKIDEEGTSKTLVVYPASGYYVNSVQIDNNTAVNISYYAGQIVQDCNAHSITYTANNTTTDNMFTLTCNRMSGTVSVVVNISSTKPSLAMSAGASCVAVESTAGGEARMVGADSTDTVYVLVAVSYRGYKFVGWTIDNGASFLADDNGTLYKDSARIPASLVKGLIVKAQFELNDNSNINTETNNTNDIL